MGEKTYQDAVKNGSGGFSATLQSIKENPMQIASLLTQQAPQLLLGGMGKAALAGVNIAGGAGRVRNDIEDAYDEIARTNPQQLLNLPEIQERMAKGMSFEEAVNDAKLDVSDNWKSILAGAAISGTEALTPLGKIGRGVNRGVIKTLGKEVGQEAFQEGAEQLNSNLVVGYIDGKTQAFDEVVRNATLGGIAGLGTGIPTAIDAGLNKPTQQLNNQSIDDIVQPTQQKEQEQVQPQPQSQAQTVNGSVLETVLSNYKDNEEQYSTIYEELENDIKDGLIAERANDNTEYGRLARAYLEQTGQQQFEQTNNDVQSDDIRYSFAGQNARNADIQQMGRAKAMLDDGVEPEVVRQQTGWFKGTDGKMRFEIMNNSELINPYDVYEDFLIDNGFKQQEFHTTLNNVWKDKGLFEAYPHLSNSMVVIKPFDDGSTIQGYFDPQTQEIVLSSQLTPKQMQQALVHEVQHRIQYMEGFLNGNSPSVELQRMQDPIFTGNKGIDQQIAQYQQELSQTTSPERRQEIAETIASYREMVADNNYRRSVGEVEARNVANRLNMSVEERKVTSPESTEDVLRENQIGRDAFGKQVYSLN